MPTTPSGNAPDWWIKACRKELMWDVAALDGIRGMDIDPIAERLWKDIEKHLSDLPERES